MVIHRGRRESRALWHYMLWAAPCLRQSLQLRLRTAWYTWYSSFWDGWRNRGTLRQFWWRCEWGVGVKISRNFFLIPSFNNMIPKLETSSKIINWSLQQLQEDPMDSEKKLVNSLHCNLKLKRSVFRVAFMSVHEVCIFLYENFSLVLCDSFQSIRKC